MNHKLIVMLLSNAYNPDDRVRNEALALVGEGYKVIILAWDRFLDKPQHEVLEGITIKRTKLKTGYGQGLGKFFSYLYLWVSYLLQVIKLEPAVVHCHDFDTYFVGCLYSILNKKVKLVLDAHENYSMMMKPLVSQAISRLIELSEKKLTRYANLVVAACDATGSHYRNMGAKNTIVVGNWKEPDLFEFPAVLIEQKRNEICANHHVIVTYIGSLTSDRNVLPLLEAVKKRQNIYAVIGGNGGQENEIRQLCSSMPNASFRGYIHPNEVPFFTALSDIIYYGLDSSDPYAPYNAPNKLFEALAAGKAILACDLGGELSRIVKSQECGILLPVIDETSVGTALDKITDPKLRMMMASNSKKAGEKQYNWNSGKKKLLESYQLLNV